MALDLIRRVKVGLKREDVARVQAEVNPRVANYLNNAMRSQLAALEDETRKQIVVHADPLRGPQEEEVVFLKDDGSKVSV